MIRVFSLSPVVFARMTPFWTYDTSKELIESLREILNSAAEQDHHWKLPELSTSWIEAAKKFTKDLVIKNLPVFDQDEDDPIFDSESSDYSVLDEDGYKFTDLSGPKRDRGYSQGFRCYQL